MSRDLTSVDILVELAERDERDSLTLRRIHYLANQSADELTAAQNRKLPENSRARMIADMHGRLMMKMTAFIYAERVQLEEVTVIVEQPADWFEHLKAQVRRWARDNSPRWAPRWLMRQLKELSVQSVDVLTAVRFEHFVKYPDYAPPADIRHRVDLFGAGISEIRVNGMWKRTERVPGWWKE